MVIINAALRLGDFSKSRKYSGSIMLPKAGRSGTFPQNYRLISLLLALSIFGFKNEHSTAQLERLVNRRINTQHTSETINWMKWPRNLLQTLPKEVRKAVDNCFGYQGATSGWTCLVECAYEKPFFFITCDRVLLFCCFCLVLSIFWVGFPYSWVCNPVSYSVWGFGVWYWAFVKPH